MSETKEPWNPAAKVLDHGFIVLRDAMPHWSMGSGDKRVVEAARVSTDHLPDHVLELFGLEPEREERTPEQDRKLIHYLMKNEHTSPFEKVRFEFIVKAPIFVARQWFRHRAGSFNELSGRYSKLPNEFYVPTLERMQTQHSTNKQASGASLPREAAEDMQMRIRGSSQLAYSQYETMLAQGLSRELARLVLPVNIYTQWYWTTDLKNILDFLRLRQHDHAQAEIAAYAHAIAPMIEMVAPQCFAAFREYRMKAG